MSGTTDIEFHIFEVDWTELRDLPEDRLAALSVASYATSEINALKRMYLGCDHEYIGNPTIDGASNVFRFLILRTWTAKIFEFWKFFDDIGKLRNVDGAVKKISEFALSDFLSLKDSIGYQVARKIRHEAANHYSFDAAKKNIRHVSQKMDCNFYTHDLGGNDFFPLGEMVMFHGCLNKNWATLDSHEKRQKNFEDWLYWNTDAAQWVAKWHAEAFDTFLGKENVKLLKKRKYSIPQEMVGDLRKEKMAIFLGDASQ